MGDNWDIKSEVSGQRSPGLNRSTGAAVGWAIVVVVVALAGLAGNFEANGDYSGFNGPSISGGGGNDTSGSGGAWEMGVDGDGYRVTCKDGTTSLSGGKSGACSHHGGVR